MHIKAIRKYKNEIDQNKNFEYEVPFTDRVEVPLEHGKKTTYCLDCHTTCHKFCAFDDDQKENCSAMGDNGHCTNCAEKCHYSRHRNQPFYVEFKKKMKKENNKFMKTLFDKNTEGKKNSEILLEKLVAEYYESRRTLIDVTNEIMRINKQLDSLTLL